MKRDYKKEYAELLRHPLWQKKRLQIMERDKWVCTGCLSSETTLNVHHKKYVWGRKPWEYEDSELITLCEICHQKHHGNFLSPKPNCDPVVTAPETPIPDDKIMEFLEMLTWFNRNMTKKADEWRRATCLSRSKVVTMEYFEKLKGIIKDNGGMK